MKKMIKLTVAASALLSTAAAYSQATPPAAAPAPEVVPAAPDGALEFSGYLDVSGNYLSKSKNFVVPNDPGTPVGPSRVFDLERNGVAIRQLAVTLQSLPKQGLGGLLNITAGKDAEVISSYGLGGGKKNKIDLTQAVVQYATGPVIFSAGKFVTLAGAEVINSSAASNFSRSILFGYAIPFTHTGARATYAVDDTLSLILGVNNGWDSFKSHNSSKTVEAGVAYTPSKIVSFSAQGYSGKEQVGGFVDGGVQGTRNLIDLVGTYNVTDKLTLIANYDYGTQANATLANNATGRAKWSGIAGYANYQLSDQWKVSGRAEYFDDHDGYRTGVAQKWKEATLTLAYLPTKAIEIRGELRADTSNVASFENSSGTSSGKSQSSVGIEALYKF